MEEASTHTPATNGAPKPEAAERTDWAELDVRSAEVQEIIGRPPHGLVRWGITAFMGVLILVLLSAWTITYPEVINAPLKLTAIHAPKTLESKVNGKLTRLLVNNNTRVREGQILAWLESTADHRQVLSLSTQIDSLRRYLLAGDMQKVHTARLAGFSDLGELQTPFQTFEQAWREFIAYLPGGYYPRRRRMLEQELAYSLQLLEHLEEQEHIQREEFELAQKEYEMNRTLAEKELIAPLELARAESNLLARRLPLEQAASAIINNHVTQKAKQKELMELDRQIAQQQAVFGQVLNTLASAIDEWKTRYLIVAPVAGRLIHAGILQENQNLHTGQEVFYIQPDNTSFFGELTISQQSYGKIREGQQVLVRFSGYPYQEFGTVTGKIAYLSDIPVRDSVFFGRVRFPEELTTNYGRELRPIDGMRGQAEIITQDMRLLERMYNNITKELK